MKSFVGVLLILYLVGTNARHVDNENEEYQEGEDQTNLMNRARDHATQARHRRRSRQSFGYEYQPPYYYDNRRDFSNRQNEEHLSQIVRSLDEIIGYLRRPLPPPQPIYIPYPVVRYVPCVSRPQNKPNQTVPNIPSRLPDFEDENQIWGSPIDEIPEVVEGEDGSRPINFEPIRPSRPVSRPAPPVEHGSNQAGNEQSTATPLRRPGACETAILTCCSIQDKTSQRNCFVRYNCLKTYSTNRACEPAVIKRVLEHFSEAYAPVQLN